LARGHGLEDAHALHAVAGLHLWRKEGKREGVQRAKEEEL
jgi:hypothetical protein